jgi:uncharacterized protein
MLTDKIHSDLVNAQKSGDAIKLATLRYLTAGIKNREIELRYLLNTGKAPDGSFNEAGELTDTESMAVIQKQVKEHLDSIDAFKKGNREDLVVKESTELSILESYLPPQMAEADIKAEVAQIASELPEAARKNFGQVMKAAMTELKGRADGLVVQRVVKEVIGN